MFQNIKQKIQPFLMGLMFGLLIGLGFFILKLDDYFKQLKLYKNIAYSVGKSESTEMKEESPKEEETIQKNKNYIYPQSKSLKPQSIDKIESEAIGDQKIKRDSIKIDSLIATQIQNKEEEIIVKKDELIVVKTIDIMLIDEEKNNNAKKDRDSLLAEVSGVSPSLDKLNIQVEYWQSPLNYKGYKMSKNKIVVYGLNQEDFLKLVRYKNEMYLQNPSGLYKLEYTSDFRSFEKASSAAIQNKKTKS